MMENAERNVRRMDLVFLFVTLVVFTSLAVTTIYTVLIIGILGLVLALVLWALAIPGWIKLTRIWIDGRAKMLKESITGRRDLLEEIAKLRESIEALRRSLES